MSEKLEKQVPNNVIALGPTKCMADDCKHKPSKAGFCEQHFDWFKAGLITKNGAKALDFDKKLYHYELKRKSA
jgi:hypothetical protein